VFIFLLNAVQNVLWFEYEHRSWRKSDWLGGVSSAALEAPGPPNDQAKLIVSGMKQTIADPN
jgi:hypothetical protein